MEQCAIVGMGLVTALGAGVEEVWRAVLASTSGIRLLRRFPHGRYGSNYAGELPEEVVNALTSQAPNGDAPLAFLLAHKAAREALAGAFPGPGSRPRGRVGLVLATTKGDLPEFENLVRDGTLPRRGHFNPYLLARDLASALGLDGPVAAVSGACASGLFALIQGARLLARGAAGAVLAVGVDVLSDFVLAGFTSVAALDPQPCRPYDAARAGLTLGEGAGAAVLARPDAWPDREMARIAGWGVANDARHITAPSRDANGLSQAMRLTLAHAGLAPAEIGYINGHGTATLYNDAMEAKAISHIFGAGTPVSSLKGYLGHTLGAAGLIEAILTVAALQARTIPASLGFTTLGEDDPIHVVNRHLPQPGLGAALTLKSGFGGINAALALGSAGDRGGRP
jgi:3-oxoacyl-(acyl-carrier-protein) synthase